MRPPGGTFRAPILQFFDPECVVTREISVVKPEGVAPKRVSVAFMRVPCTPVRFECSPVWDEVAVSRDAIEAIWDPIVVIWESTVTAVLTVAMDWSSWISGSRMRCGALNATAL